MPDFPLSTGPNLGMLTRVFPRVIDLLEKPHPAGMSRYEDCVVSSSISREVFTHTQRKDEIWYSIDLDLPTDLVELARKLGDDWAQYGQPWIDRMTNHAKVSELVAQLTTKYPEAEDPTKQWIARHGFH